MALRRSSDRAGPPQQHCSGRARGRGVRWQSLAGCDAGLQRAAAVAAGALRRRAGGHQRQPIRRTALHGSTGRCRCAAGAGGCRAQPHPADREPDRRQRDALGGRCTTGAAAGPWPGAAGPGDRAREQNGWSRPRPRRPAQGQHWAATARPPAAQPRPRRSEQQRRRPPPTEHSQHLARTPGLANAAAGLRSTPGLQLHPAGGSDRRPRGAAAAQGAAPPRPPAGGDGRTPAAGQGPGRGLGRCRPG